jgi:FKBP-type peptidyl-prolyl cis-trans isomerase
LINQSQLAAGGGPIGPNETLIFVVDVISVS